jgi:hypothetical protein
MRSTQAELTVFVIAFALGVSITIGPLFTMMLIAK